MAGSRWPDWTSAAATEASRRELVVRVLGLLRTLLGPERGALPFLADRQFMADGATRRGAQQGMVSGKVTSDAPDHGAGQAAGVSLADQQYRHGQRQEQFAIHDLFHL